MVFVIATTLAWLALGAAATVSIIDVEASRPPIHIAFVFALVSLAAALIG